MTPPASIMGLPDSWVYRDIPWMTFQELDILLKVIGEENFKFIATTRAPRIMTGGEKQMMIRGQAFISPEGIERGVKQVEKNREV